MHEFGARRGTLDERDLAEHMHERLRGELTERPAHAQAVAIPGEELLHVLVDQLGHDGRVVSLSEPHARHRHR